MHNDRPPAGPQATPPEDATPGTAPGTAAQPASGLGPDCVCCDPTGKLKFRTFRERMSEPRFSAVLILLFALGGPLFIGGLTWLLNPTMPWPTLVMEAVDTGWVSPMLILVVFTVILAAIEVRRIRQARYVLRGTSMLIGVAAVRARYYIDQGHAQAADMALHDMVNYLRRRAPRETRRQWEDEVFAWYDTHPVARELPRPPRIHMDGDDK